MKHSSRTPTLLSLSLIATTLACSGEVQNGFGAGNGGNGLRITRKTGAAADGTTNSGGLEPGQIPDNIAGANLTMDCSPYDSKKGDGLTSLECYFLFPDKKVFPGAVALEKATITRNGQEQNAGARVGAGTQGAYQAVFLENLRVLEIPSISRVAIEAKLVETSISQNFDPTPDTFTKAKNLDTLDPTPDLATCGSKTPQMISLSSNSGTCQPGGVVIFWSASTKKMACCTLKEPSLLLAPQTTTRDTECKSDEVITGFQNHDDRKVRCTMLDKSRVRLTTDIQTPSAINFTGLGGLVTTMFTVMDPDAYAAGAVMLKQFGKSSAVGCKDEFLFHSLAKNYIAMLGAPDTFPRCRKLDPLVKY